MREIVVIGVGAGDPEQVTMQAVSALNRVDVFFVLDKGEVKQELVDLREEILRRYAKDKQYRVVVGRDPERDRTSSAYVDAVDDWRRRRADVCASLIASELGDDEVGAFLVWGDPSLYDSTLAILDDIRGRGELTFELEVIPGISSVSTLAARHRVGLNQVGRPIQVTTGRRLAKAWPDDVDDIVVMLDAQTAFTRAPGPGRRHLLGRLPRHPRRDPDLGSIARGRRRHREGPRRGPQPQGLDHGHLPVASEPLGQRRCGAEHSGGGAVASRLCLGLRRTGAPVCLRCTRQPTEGWPACGYRAACYRLSSSRYCGEPPTSWAMDSWS
jgi:precorrin-6A synthase